MTLHNVKISLRTDSLSNWIAEDPVLNDGELAIVNDISASLTRFKVGNGVSAFSQLSYVNQQKVITQLLDANTVQTHSLEQGANVDASPFGLAAGAYLSANANFTQVMGLNAQASAGNDYSFVWNGDDTRAIGDFYQSHGKGTFSVNPLSGLSGVYVGEQSLHEILSSCEASVESKIPLSVSQLVNDIGYLSSHQSLSGYYMKTETSSSAEISDALSSKQDTLTAAQLSAVDSGITLAKVQGYDSYQQQIDAKITIDDRISSILDQTDLSIIKLSANEYDQIVANDGEVSNCLYVIDSDFEDAYGHQIKNLAAGTDLSDAVNLQQLDSTAALLSASLSGALTSADISAQYTDQHIYLSASGQVVGDIDCSDFIRDGMLSDVELCSGQLVFIFNTDASATSISVALSNFIDETQYWKKTETSSASEISTAFDQLSNYYAKTETSSASEISVALDGKQPSGDYVTMPQLSSKADTSAVENISSDLESLSSSLSDYYAKTETSSASQISIALDQLSDYYTKQDTSSAVEISTALGNFYTKSETSSSSELSLMFSQKSTVMFVDWED